MNQQNALLGLVALNIASTILHFTDNVCFFSHYPEPTWLSARLVDGFWFPMTGLALLGCYWYRTNAKTRSYFSFYVYAGLSLLVLGHYLIFPRKNGHESYAAKAIFS